MKKRTHNNLPSFIVEIRTLKFRSMQGISYCGQISLYNHAPQWVPKQANLFEHNSDGYFHTNKAEGYTESKIPLAAVITNSHFYSHEALSLGHLWLKEMPPTSWETSIQEHKNVLCCVNNWLRPQGTVSLYLCTKVYFRLPQVMKATWI